MKKALKTFIQLKIISNVCAVVYHLMQKAIEKNTKRKEVKKVKQEVKKLEKEVERMFKDNPQLRRWNEND